MNRFVKSALTSMGLSLACMMALTSPAEAKFNKVSPSVLKVEGVRYWRAKASEAQLGSIGEKRTPVVGKNRYQKIQSPKNANFKVTVDGVINISSEDAKKFDLEVSRGKKKQSGSVSSSSSYKGNLKAYKMRLELGNAKGGLRYEMNRNHSYLKAFEELGNKGRIISAVWILVDSDETHSSCFEGEIQVKAKKMTVKAGGSSCNTTSWTIAPGSIVAYEMVKANRWNKKEIASSPKCPRGYWYDAKRGKDRCVKKQTVTTGVKCKLGLGRKRANWKIVSKNGRDVCMHKTQQKKPKAVTCDKSGYSYVAQKGRDKCRKVLTSYKKPSCKSGFRLFKNSRKDTCNMKGIKHLKVDTQDGF